MFNKKAYNDSKILLELLNTSNKPRELYEPVIRKLGGVWNKSLNGWLFDIQNQIQIDQFIEKHNIDFAEDQNKEYYTRFVSEPDNFNTPSSRSSSNGSAVGINEAFDLIQELFDRVSDIEKILEEHTKKLNNKR